MEPLQLSPHPPPTTPPHHATAALNDNSGIEANPKTTSVASSASNQSSYSAAPRLIYDPNTGKMVVDKSSLEQRSVAAMDDTASVVVRSHTKSTYSSYSKHTPSQKWSAKETNEFYDALSVHGLDFYGMTSLFPNRSHKQLKKKYQREDKVNRDKVDEALKPSSRSFTAKTVSKPITDHIHFNPGFLFALLITD